MGVATNADDQEHNEENKAAGKEAKKMVSGSSVKAFSLFLFYLPSLGDSTTPHRKMPASNEAACQH